MHFEMVGKATAKPPASLHLHLTDTSTDSDRTYVLICSYSLTP